MINLSINDSITDFANKAGSLIEEVIYSRDNGVINIDNLAGISVTFNESFSDVNSISITLTNRDGNPLIGSVSNVTTTNFLARCYDNTGAASTGNFSWFAYGRKGA